MKGRRKEHRAPTRYSLYPEEIRGIVSHLRRRGHITDAQIFSLSRKLGCSQKTVHEIVSRHGYEVISAFKPDHDIKPTKRRKINEDDSEVALLEPVPEQKEVSEAERREQEVLDFLSSEEDRLNRDFRSREDELLQAIEALEEELRLKQEELDSGILRTKEAMDNTRKLRVATREDREALETLRGEITVLTQKNKGLVRQNEKLVETNFELRKELRDGLERERRLLDALERSENDLEVWKSDLT